MLSSIISVLLGLGGLSQAQTPPVTMPSVAQSTSCPSGVSIYNDDATELAKTLSSPEVKQQKGEVIIAKKEVKTPGGATLSCEIFSDKMSGKPVLNFEGRKSTCTLTPPSAGVTPATNGMIRQGGNRIPLAPSRSAPPRQ